MSERFRDYKQKLRRKATMRKHGASSPLCERCGVATEPEEYGWRCPSCGNLQWSEPNPNFKVNLPPPVYDDRPGAEFGVYER